MENGNYPAPRVPGNGTLTLPSCAPPARRRAAIPGNPWQGRGGRQPGGLLTDENAARGSVGRGGGVRASRARGGGVEASTAAASPAVPLPGALSYARALLGAHLAALGAAWRNSDRGAS